MFIVDKLEEFDSRKQVPLLYEDGTLNITYSMQKAACWYLVLLGCAEHWGLRLTIRILKQLT